MFLVATMINSQWMNHELFASIMIILPIPLFLFAERVWTKRKDWLLEPKEMIRRLPWPPGGE